jgi:hypothetical protein
VDHLKLLKVPADTRQLLLDDPKVSLRIIAEIGSIENNEDRTDLIQEVRRRNENGWNTQDIIKLVKLLKQAVVTSPLSLPADISPDQKQTPEENRTPKTPREEDPKSVPSLTLQHAKFKLSWEKRHQFLQKTFEKIVEEQPATYEQYTFVQKYLEEWLHTLQEITQRLQPPEQRDEENPSVYTDTPVQ